MIIFSNLFLSESAFAQVILGAVVPVGFIITIGYIAGKKLSLDQSTLSQLSVYVLAPALVTHSLYRSQVSGNDALLLLLGYGIISLILYGFVSLISCFFRFSLDDRRSLYAISLCPNNGNMGLPIIAFALGEAGLERAVIYMIGSSILLFGLLPMMLKGKGWLVGLQMSWKLPLFWSILLGLSLQLTNIELPFNLGKSLEWLGISAIPMALLILGLQLGNIQFNFSLPEMGASLIKLAIAPIVALGVGKFLGLTGLDLQVLILQTAMPTAVNSLVMIKEFGGNATMVARTIIISTLMSFATIPLVIWLVT